MTNYFNRLTSKINEVADILLEKGIKSEYLSFDATEDLGQTIRVPTVSKSEFLANRAMGDWAENLIIDQVNSDNEYSLIKYGSEQTISAGEEGFKDFYISQKKEVLQYGKRPDVLIFDREYNKKKNLVDLDILGAKQYVEGCLTSIEIRSSAFESEVYKKVREQQKKEGKKGITKMTLGFTVKVEDLKIVYRWMKFHRKTQSYVQVFLDKVYGISFMEILNLISSRQKEIKIEKHAKNQMKTTIFIPVSFGDEIATVVSKPEIFPIKKISELGRHDYYTEPRGGEIKINYANFKKALLSD